MTTARKSFDSLGRASYVQQDQVHSPDNNQQANNNKKTKKTQSTPAYQPYASSTDRGQQPPRGSKGQPITEPDYRPMKGPAEGLVEDTGQEDPGSQVDKQ